MRVYSISDYILATSSERAFANLLDIHLTTGLDGSPSMRTSSRYLELDAIWKETPCRICCPIDTTAIHHAERLSASLKRIDTPLLAAYHLLPKELRLGNDLCDIVLEVHPEGEPLNQILARKVSAKQARALAAEWIATAEALTDVPFSHRALSTSRIIVRTDGGMTLCGLHHGRIENSIDDHRAIIEITYEILRSAIPNAEFPAINELVTTTDRRELCARLCAIAGETKVRPIRRPAEHTQRITRKLLDNVDFTNREWIGIISEDRIAFREGDRYGFLDMLNNVVIEPQFVRVEPFRECRAIAETDEGVGLINKQGEWIITPEHKELYWSADYNIATVCNAHGWALYDSLGNRRNRYFDYLGVCSDHRLAACSNKRWGYIDTHGCEVIALRYDDAFEYENGRAQVVLDGRPFEIDINGLEIL